ncbi:MAG: AraC family ligand binding domain-containing protein, partial [Micromonosporaceae bacterium]
MTLATVAAADRLVDLNGLLDTCQVDGFRADFVSWGFYRMDPWRNYWHSHSFYEVCVSYAGAGRFSTGGVDHEVGTGVAFLARPGDVHEIEASAADPLGIAYWGFTLMPGRTAPDLSRPGWWSGLSRSDRPVVSDRLGALPALVAALAAEAAAPRSGYPAALA